MNLWTICTRLESCRTLAQTVHTHRERERELRPKNIAKSSFERERVREREKGRYKQGPGNSGNKSSVQPIAALQQFIVVYGNTPPRRLNNFRFCFRACFIFLSQLEPLSLSLFFSLSLFQGFCQSRESRNENMRDPSDFTLYRLKEFWEFDFYSYMTTAVLYIGSWTLWELYEFFILFSPPFSWKKKYIYKYFCVTLDYSV